MRPTLSADTTLLNPTKRNDRLADQARIRADHADLQPLCDPPHPAHIPGEEISSQADIGVVGQLDDLVLRLESCERGERAEGLFGVEQGVRGHVGEDGWDEEGGVGDGLATDQDLSTFFDCVR
ncbi:hypothetical protein NLJ89_g5046 [Agrocybe chaxingu]|uniref:Uncharacterized protein n=1 Tax=Agrocybe chaxingu TaxID=84603 RepID=A0A9W8MXJ1_9AGAR|nr:hypothetical protein NLJ89_g5046 [Agrocybe chaxingu]